MQPGDSPVTGSGDTRPSPVKGGGVLRGALRAIGRNIPHCGWTGRRAEGRWRPGWRLGTLALIAGFGGAGWAALDRWVATTALPPLAPELSVTVLDRDGRLLRPYTVDDGLWRLPVAAAKVDRGYLAQLLAYEDRRFFDHAGVDPWAMTRAVWQALRAGRVVSGGSTLTMQVARLLEDAPTGRLDAKLRQIRLALALERRLTKRQILGLYLVLAPFGGNIEGVRAASLAWFGKEPHRLTAGEAALLVALPQAPEARRPDRRPSAARAARDRVLARGLSAGLLTPEDVRIGRAEPAPSARHDFPLHAIHLTDRLRREAPDTRIHHTTLDRDLQARLEVMAAARLREIGPALSTAIMVADHRSGEVLAEIGAADPFAASRGGWVDMTRALRSPGSALKPLVYGLAFEAGLAHPESLIEDRPTNFSGYRPQNFDATWRGTVTLRKALVLSLNIPAVAVLEAVGPARLMARLRRAGARVSVPGRVPGLAVALGGLGIGLRDMTALYAAMARGGEAVVLRDRPGPIQAGRRILAPNAAWQVGDILAGTAPPPSARHRRLAYKTGTSYGHRDAWALGFDGAHVVGVWIGRPDGTAVPGILGLDTAAPLLFEAFGRLKTQVDPLPGPPGSVLTLSTAELPAPLKRLRRPGERVAAGPAGPSIAFPPDGARVELGLAGAAPMELFLKVEHGTPPFTWLAEGRPLGPRSWERSASHLPGGPGFLTLSVIDAEGRSDRVRVRLD